MVNVEPREATTAAAKSMPAGDKQGLPSASIKPSDAPHLHPGSSAPAAEVQATRARIADALYSHRRPCPGEEKDVCVAKNYSEAILKKLDHFISQSKPIHLIIPAFPLKSESPLKTLGARGEKQPDMAELLSLRNLQGICNDVQKIYPPGAKITIYSDGGIFANALRPEYTDQARHSYLLKIKEMIEAVGASGVIEIKDTEGEVARDVWEKYSEPIDSIKERMKTDRNLELLHTGQKRFFVEEGQGLNPGLKKTAIIKQASQKAYAITRGSAALSRYLDVNEPNAIRISCHPKEMGTEKLGIWMDEGRSTVTPWHGVAALTNRPNAYSIMHAKNARELGLNVAEDDTGKPSHFEISEELNRVVLLIQRYARERSVV